MREVNTTANTDRIALYLVTFVVLNVVDGNFNFCSDRIATIVKRLKVSDGGRENCHRTERTVELSGHLRQIKRVERVTSWEMCLRWQNRIQATGWEARTGEFDYHSTLLSWFYLTHENKEHWAFFFLQAESSFSRVNFEWMQNHELREFRQSTWRVGELIACEHRDELKAWLWNSSFFNPCQDSDCN